MLVGCGESQQTAPAPEAKPVEPVAGAKAPAISIYNAAGFGDIEAIKQHLAAGADVNAKTPNGWTPLLMAISYAQKEIAELLLANGARLISFEAYELGSIWGDEPKRSISPAQE